ncbi:protein kinase domain-containing protein [Nocardiopsis synnemataformans]|uniref:serine/threonine-protein kinase n=1 Tax=Nocardiopsis synnemataformans TaxID=61305 RepID=UPI003EBC5ACC
MEDLTADDPQRIGSYRLLARLGEGGMGRVYLARTPTRRIVVKVIRQHFTHDPTFRKRFAREIGLASQVAGPYTAAVIDADPYANEPWLAIEYVPGPSLHEAVAHTGPLPNDTLLVLTAGLAEALAAIHRADIVHRDLKPANVLLAADAPRVIDFGIAKAVQENTVTPLTPTQGTIGTPTYMSPEQVLGQEITPASDVFSLGSLIYYAATGKSPFGPNDSAIYFRILNISPEPALLDPFLDNLVRSCLEKAPQDRPSPQQILDTVGEIDLTADTWIPPQVRELSPESHTQIIDHVATTRQLTKTSSGNGSVASDNSSEHVNSPTPKQDNAPATAHTDTPVTLPDTANNGGEEDHEQLVAEAKGYGATLGTNPQNTLIPRTDPAARTRKSVTWNKAIARLRALGPDHPRVLTIRHNLASQRGEAGDPTAAVTAYEQLLPDEIRVLGPDHPLVLTTRHNLASQRGKAGDPTTAAQTYEQLLPDRTRVLGPDHPDTLTTRHNLAHWRGEAGDPTAAVTAYEQLLPDEIRVLGPDHPRVLTTRARIAKWTYRSGDAVKAIELLKGLLRDQERVLGTDHPDIQVSKRLLLDWEASTERVMQPGDL